MQKTCTACGHEFVLTEHDLQFFAQMGVPEPTLCPEDLWRTRLAFRCEVDLRKGTCNKTNTPFITNQPEHIPYPVYAKDVWWSDGWDPLEYGRAVKTDSPFLAQFTELSKVVPQANIVTTDSENSDYTNFATHNKNCYLIFGSWYNEGCLFGQSIYYANSCLDCHYIQKCQYCYQCIDCNECYETFYGQNCQNCTDSWFLYDCRKCENCIGCWNLRGKKYHIWNKEVSKEEFEKTAQELRTSRKARTEFRKKFREYIQNDAIHRSLAGEKNENVSGDFIYNSRNVTESYNVQESEDIYYSDRTIHQKDQYFCTGVHEGELAYYSLNVDYSHNIICCMNGEHLADCAYCFNCYSCEQCFGCIGLRHKKYCILNKQYSEEEYHTLKEKIIDQMKKDNEWGEYFPISCNPFYYNRTVANDFFPLTKEEAEERGYHWKTDLDEIPKVEKSIEAKRLPDNINDIPDDVLNWAISCEATKRPFLVVKQELEFYRKFKLTIPHFHPEERSKRRLALRNPRKLFKRTCMNCKKDIQTTYASDRKEKVFCEECYVKEIY